MNNNTLFTKDVTLAAGATGLSEAFTLNGGHAIVGLIMPATWVTADITFQISMDPIAHVPADAAPSNFYNVFDETGGEVTVSGPAASRAIMLAQNVYITGNYFKIRSGTSALAVDQTASRTIKVIYRSV